MNLEIVTPEASLVRGEVKSLIVPGVNGEFQMLSNHAAVVSLLVEGKVKFEGEPTITEGFEDKFVKESDGKWSLAITSGTLEMNNNKATILNPNKDLGFPFFCTHKGAELILHLYACVCKGLINIF
jgi:F-type H+-transporting ATPase subunit epsilon